MGWFSRKKAKVEEKEFVMPELPHTHVWKDFPWYMECEYSGPDKRASYKIVEPYLCITCGERKDVVLEKQQWSNIDPDTREEWYQKVRRRYKKYLKPRAIVEDMINNVLLVKDPGRLAVLEEMRGSPHKNVGTSAEQDMVNDTEYKIKMPERDYGEMK